MNWQIGLNFYSTQALLFNPSDLEEVKATIQDQKFHIYLICKRKKLHFESTNQDGANSGKTVLFFLNDAHDKQRIYIKHPFVINAVKDNYYNITLNGQTFDCRDAVFINNSFFLEKDLVGDSVSDALLSDLEIMYIGQAFGRKERKMIDYRLAKHEKIQQIALDIADKGSNEEVIIIGLKIEVNDLTTAIVTLDDQFIGTSVVEIKELQKKASQRLSEGQAITVFEASLIKYFQPALNTEYKETFPSPDFGSYDELFDTSFNYSAMTIDTRPVGVRIFSQHQPERKYIHAQHFPLTSKSDKKELFEYLLELNE